MLGQWRCLMYAPERQGAKELMYVCLNLVVIASLMNVAGTNTAGETKLAAHHLSAAVKLFTSTLCSRFSVVLVPIRSGARIAG